MSLLIFIDISMGFSFCKMFGSEPQRTWSPLVLCPQECHLQSVRPARAARPRVERAADRDHTGSRGARIPCLSARGQSAIQNMWNSPWDPRAGKTAPIGGSGGKAGQVDCCAPPSRFWDHVHLPSRQRSQRQTHAPLALTYSSHTEN